MAPTAGLIAVFDSSTHCTAALAGLSRLPLGTLRLNLVVPAAAAPTTRNAYPTQGIEDAEATATALSSYLSSAGRYGLAGLAGGAVLGAFGALVVLVVLGFERTLPGGGFSAGAGLIAGSAVALMQIGLPFGAILEHCRVESRRLAYRDCLQHGGCVLLASGDKRDMARFATWLRTSTRAHPDRFRVPELAAPSPEHGVTRQPTAARR